MAHGTSTKGWVAGAAGIGAAGIGAAANRLAARGRRPRDADASRAHAITVRGPVDAVRAAWEAEGAGLPGAAVDFRPAPGDRGTELRARPAVADDEGTTHQAVRSSLRTFKARFEAGDVVTTQGQPTGRSSGQEAVTRSITQHLRAWGAA